MTTIGGKMAVPHTNETREVARPLKVLVPLIKEELEAGEEAGLEHFRRAGVMLLEARTQIPPGRWTAWIHANFTRNGDHLSRKTADRYMKLARRDAADVLVAHRRGETLTSMTEPALDASNPGHMPAWHRTVRDAVSFDTERYTKERQTREKEKRLEHLLGLRLIDVGYRVLSTKLHPDKPGGSVEAMRRLNRVRDILKGAI
jgi:hypothetical protein